LNEQGAERVHGAERLPYFYAPWKTNPRPAVSPAVPRDLSEALARNRTAKEFFEKLAPAYQKHFIGWIVTAKRPETRTKRLKESLALLEKGEKLGLE